MRITHLTVLGLFALSSASGAELYTITDLGPGYAIGLNNQGVVLGRDSQGPFIYQAGQRQYLPQPAGGVFQAGAINDLGEVAGTTNVGSGNQFYLTTYLNGALTVNAGLPDLAPTAINNAGQITGVEVSQYESFLYSSGTLTTIGSAGSTTSAVGINSSGIAVGFFYPPQIITEPQAFVFSNGQFTPLPVPGTTSEAGAINDLSTIAGSYGTNPNSPGLTAGVFVYDDATGFRDLGPAFGETIESDGVEAINNAGVIVGNALISVAPYSGVWGYFPGTGFMNLNAVVDPNSGWDLGQVIGINNAGDIVGSGTIKGNTDIFLLTPVPEPSTALLLIAALMLPLVFVRPHAHSCGSPKIRPQIRH